MSSEVNEDLTCAICYEIYEEIQHEPVLLPKCGHSFCRPCLLNLEVDKTNFLCPTCRSPHLGPSITEVPTIYALLSVSSKIVIQQKKDGVFEIKKQIKFQIKEQQESLSRRLNAIAKEIMVLYEKSKILKEFINEVEELEAITKQTQELFNLKKALSDIKSIHSQVTKVTNDMRQSGHSTKISSDQYISEAETNWALCNTNNVPGCINTWPKVPWDDFMKQLPSAQLLASSDTPDVFFDLAAGEKSLGRITIRLWGHMTRAQHFLALCLGTFGPTYKGSSFDRIEEEEDGENMFLIGGYYNTNGGTKSARGLIEDLEWDNEYRQHGRRGLIAGWSYENPELEATFGFTCGKSFSADLCCPFGEVLSGMKVLDGVLSIMPITDVKIADCGIITSYNAE